MIWALLGLALIYLIVKHKTRAQTQRILKRQTSSKFRKKTKF